MAAKLFRGLADPTRLGILQALSQSPLCVGEVVAVTGLRQPNVSNHLACLKDCGLVTSVRRGRRIYYRTSDIRVNELLASAEELVAHVATGVPACSNYGPDGDG